MPKIKPISLGSANPHQKKLLEGLKAKMGRIPAIYATIAHSPTTLEAMLTYNESLKKGTLSPKEIEAVALAVGQTNDCGYCVAAHTMLGKMAGLSVEETLECRRGKAHDPKLDALVKLASEIVKTRGLPSAKTLADFRAAGYSDGSIVEVIAWTTYNIFTNYFNHIAETVSDFPNAPELI